MRRRALQHQISARDELVANALSSTHGVLCTQEDVMKPTRFPSAWEEGGTTNPRLIHQEAITSPKGDELRLYAEELRSYDRAIQESRLPRSAPSEQSGRPVYYTTRPQVHYHDARPTSVSQGPASVSPPREATPLSPVRFMHGRNHVRVGISAREH